MQRMARERDDGRGWRGRPDERALLAEAASELALGVWVGLSLLGITLGLAVASLAQVWTRQVLAPGALVGGVLVLASLGLTLLASYRYQCREACLPRALNSPRPLALVSVFVVVALAWVVLAIIFLTGWDFPISLLWGPVRAGA